MLEIKIPYTTFPQMTRATGPLFTLSNNYRYRKTVELYFHHDDLFGIDSEETKKLVIEASNRCGVEQTDNIVLFALNFEEDVAIIHKGKLAAICFCFPSSWIPKERIGMHLSEIHSAVADSERLVKASEQIAKVMCTQPFERYVWTISNSRSLSQHPGAKSNIEPKSLKDLYFRVEKQTTMPLNEDSSLFFVHVTTTPLEIVFKDTVKKQKIVDSINSMSYNILQYKNLEVVKKILNRPV